MNKPKIYSYIRFSKDIQIKGDSLRRQNESIDKYKKLKGYDFDETLTFQDLGKSGWTGKNIQEGGKLHQFLEEIKKGNVPSGSILLVEALDRISRTEPTVFLSLFIEIINSGITIVTTVDQQEYNKENFNNDIAKLLSSIVQMTLANKESSQKSKRLKEAWNAKRQNIGTKFYTSRVPSWIKADKIKNKLEIIPEKVAIVQRFYKMILDGDHCEGVAKKLNKEGVPPLGKNHRWDSSIISGTIRSVSVTGRLQTNIMVNGKRVKNPELVENYYPRIISDVDFAKANQILSDRCKNGKNGRVSDAILFKKMLFCGYCGASMHLVKKGGDTYRKNGSRFYVCSNAKSGASCMYYAWNAKEFETSFVESAKELQINMTEGQAVKDAILERDEIQVRCVEVQAKINNIVEVVESGMKSVTLLNKLTALESELITLKSDLMKAENEVSKLKNPIANLDDFKLYICNYDNVEHRKKASLIISSIYEKIYIFPAGSRSLFASISAKYKSLVASGKYTASSISAQIREFSDRKKHRFFVCKINGSGVNGRTGFPVNAITPEDLLNMPDEIDGEYFENANKPLVKATWNSMQQKH